ncbi:CDP-diacylglycerol--glycerol-3-phosphate 3-phosphatidyltransferase [Zooshikella harenae]|uniref:CDP-diacylglycerol--glycerol-3-phosphate 3-phosphatidyltransferase n=1 Tax=Zooshikella harenae TaxID=2827238 RepID=A0ABS5ZG55_9GAMM|nr:CDP-diacylglycerol--glycerol-3-phosphate 3-phosphatidyltransferase [Zooshikella harenae]MBU2713042.1 CDP-diacylglycerol--glycerol-3-phosphate 3-phosphatidyltransferase [Zooshikella harenae]
MNIPNYLTLLRIVLIPVIVLVYYLPQPWSYQASAGIFALAGITDWFDGYLARRLNQATPFGAFLDPVADKLMVAIALALLVEEFSHIWLTIPAIIIIGREIVISALREWMAEIGKRTSVAVSFVGKLKTAVQMLSIFLLLASPAGYPTTIFYIGISCLYLAAILTLWSMVVYLRTAWADLSPLKE